ncbi:type VI secretion system protein TssA [Oceanobacter mangrovi]|uniref:type VI secretion system protein TssA n=1 Tax=Oceanobacter mangrovi TaxID=2862510 RepID=UPI001C8D5796|nr:type VI secretion system protein TssA [Oceanobacter mangrovi]
MSCITLDEIQQLLIPLELDEGPAGPDLRDNIAPDSSYQLLRDVRTTARNNERSASQLGEENFIQADDWHPILDHVPGVLRQESKDIEMVAWYIEALTRKYGFLGLARGYRLAAGLIEGFGEQLYPRPDEDGLTTQLGPLIGLNGYGNEGALIVPIKSIIIASSDSLGQLAIWQYEQALETDRISDEKKKAARLKQGVLSKAEVEAVAKGTSVAFLKATRKALSEALEAYQYFQQVLDQYATDDPQPSMQVLDTLKTCEQMLTYVAGDRLQEEEMVAAEQTTEDVAGDETAEAVSPQAVMTAAVIANRNDAVKTLQKVADYFRQAEPHSPISYSIEQIIRWSNLSLPELIAQLIPDDGARQKFQTLSGIQPGDTGQ